MCAENKKLKEITEAYGIPGDKILKVSEISNHIKKKLTTDHFLKQIYVLGEITNISQPINGHIYFSIKDKESLLSCTLFKPNNRLNFEMKNGTEVLVLGSINTYAKNSIYQLNVSLVFPIGEGMFAIKFKRLKEKLEKEGLFDENKKKEVQEIPNCIGLITSEKGQALDDVTIVLQNRSTTLKVIFIATLTQGEKAPKQIINAIEKLNKNKRVETILLVRGGGSDEDLSCFNDEELARAIFNSKKPIITGIGHESDYTIADFVSDRRAPTPSIAGEMAIVHREEMLATINYYREELEKRYNHFIEMSKAQKQTEMYKLIIFIIMAFIILYLIIRGLTG